jgi:hypothetical protein
MKILTGLEGSVFPFNDLSYYAMPRLNTVTVGGSDLDRTQILNIFIPYRYVPFSVHS